MSLKLNGGTGIEFTSNTQFVDNAQLKFKTTSQTFTVKGIDAAITDSQTGTAPDTSDSDSGQLAIYNGAAKLWGITEHGWMTNPNRPAFHVYGASGSESNLQTWSSATQAYQNLQLTGKATLNNNDNNYDTTSYRYTAPISGMYIFMVKITQSTTTGGPSCTLHKNGSVWQNEMTISYSNSYLSSLGITMGYVGAGDYIEAKVINFNSVAITLEKARCSFSGYLIG